MDAHQFASTATRNEDFVKDFAPQIPAFLEALEDFWSNVADSAHYHIQDLHGTKAVFGGDLFPSYQKNIASTAGLYMDTIVLSDLFSQSRHIFKGAGVERQIYYLAKHTLNVLDYKDLATADFPNPIVAFAPFRSSIDESAGEFLKEVSTKDGLVHASHLFGKQFSDSDALWAYADKLQTPESVVAALADPERLLFDTDWTGSLEDQITRSLEGDWNELIGGDPHAGKLVVGQSFGRMGQATDILLKSRYLSGIPLIDAPTSRKYFNWKLEYNSAISPDDNANLHMVQGLQRAADTDEEWLGNIPPKALIEMRKEGAFDEIRSVLSSGVDSLAQTNPDNFWTCRGLMPLL